MPAPSALVLEFPAMLHGHLGAIRRDVRAQGKAWAREYLKTGGFTQPKRMIQVPPGGLLLMHSGAEFDINPHERWRPHLLHGVFPSMNDGVPDEASSLMEEAFETFCLSTPWGALDHAVAPLPLRSAHRMARRLAALLRFWDVLRLPRYAYRVADTHHTLDELIAYLYRETMDAWCPGGPASVREHLTLMVERMARATREDCLEALLRLIPILVKMDTGLRHREQLSDPRVLRERLLALPTADFDDVSSGNKYTVATQLSAWDRALARRDRPPHD
ncbi:hypothetical protein [Archangium primigenium]|uniref:hypothetical protein n=1 Tax=[Archangium] primigenium TaxID=2792470 RepID=UPI001958336A|nr:hypothetical protein [Archangium primigenium]MBM7119422.1 hypothetical protein [Archangium primigenium]